MKEVVGWIRDPVLGSLAFCILIKPDDPDIFLSTHHKTSFLERRDKINFLLTCLAKANHGRETFNNPQHFLKEPQVIETRIFTSIDYALITAKTQLIMYFVQ